MNTTSYQPPSGPFAPLSYQAPAGNVATKSRTGYVSPAYQAPKDYSTGFNRPTFSNNPGADAIALANAKTGLFPRTGQGGFSAKRYSSSGFSGAYEDQPEMDAEQNKHSGNGLFSHATLTSLFQGGPKTYAIVAGIALIAGGLAVGALSLGDDSTVQPDKTTTVQPVDVSTIPSVQLSTDPVATIAEAAASTPSVGAEMLSKMADVYVNNWHFSAARVIQILTNSEVTHASPAEAQTALDSLGPVNWNGVALAAAHDAIANDGVPAEGVHDYLVSADIGFTEEQAQFAVDNLNQIP